MIEKKIIIGVLVVTYNQYELTKKFIINFSNLFSEDNRIKLLILDNNSKDGTYINIKKEFPHVDIRLLNNNYGCVTGRNIGIVELINLQVDYICILDNDIEIRDPNFFNELITFMEDNIEIDGCCTIVKYANDGEEQTRGARLKTIKIQNITKYNISLEEIFSKFIIVDMLPGCFQFIRTKSFLKFGLYDNDLSPISIEDYEWGIRATSNGAKLVCYNNLEVFHHTDKSHKFSNFKNKNIIIGRIIFLRKYFTLFNIFREMKYFLYNLINYGIFYTFSAILIGLTKKITKDNYLFENFIKKDINDFYKKQS